MTDNRIVKESCNDDLQWGSLLDDRTDETISKIKIIEQLVHNDITLICVIVKI